MTEEELKRRHDLLRSNPRSYLALVQEEIRQHPSNADGYFNRHHAWIALGRRDLALRDLSTAIDLDPHYINFFSRGCLLRDLGRYKEAIADFDRAFAGDIENQLGGFGALFRADCHARLGDVDAALKDCERLPEDHWTPGPMNLPAGDKDQVAAELRRRAATAHASNLQG